MRIALLLCAAPLLFEAFYSFRLSYADWLFRQNTSASVARAAALEPANGHYQAWLAERLENEGRDSTLALAAAARLNPMDSRVWIRRGLNAELSGDLPQAEHLLLHAAAIDRLMEPRWTLMNFYFRQGNVDQFWRWAKESFEMSYGDRAPLFELCWQVKEDASFIASRALPPSYPVLLQFFQFLVGKQQYDPAATLAKSILPKAPEADKPEYLACLQRLMDTTNLAPAVRIWNGLCARGFEPFRQLDPARGISLTNGDFTSFPSGIGFDWRLFANQNSPATKTRAGLKITLSGNQPDRCDLLTQTVPLLPSRGYRLRFSFSTNAARDKSGFHVRVLDKASPDLASEQLRQETLNFHSGEQSSAAIVFEYRRPLGYVRTEESLFLQDVTLDLLE